jgi:hypothetical protein
MGRQCLRLTQLGTLENRFSIITQRFKAWTIERFGNFSWIQHSGSRGLFFPIDYSNQYMQWG